MGSSLDRYLVEFTDPFVPDFLCYAEGIDHAIEQAINAYPDELVFSVHILVEVWAVRYEEVKDAA